jgi:methylmalonyl-CoA mutase cobalamin-binding subunit
MFALADGHCSRAVRVLDHEQLGADVGVEAIRGPEHLSRLVDEELDEAPHVLGVTVAEEEHDTDVPYQRIRRRASVAARVAGCGTNVPNGVGS